uniref:EF-hand calcium binding domain 5 n=1 Tax=Leptobrachium leishanense TaxID=445787 RepID=A0A8C5PZV0_9ANUR
METEAAAALAHAQCRRRWTLAEQEDMEEADNGETEHQHHLPTRRGWRWCWGWGISAPLPKPFRRCRTSRVRMTRLALYHPRGPESCARTLRTEWGKQVVVAAGEPGACSLRGESRKPLGAHTGSSSGGSTACLSVYSQTEHALCCHQPAGHASGAPFPCWAGQVSLFSIPGPSAASWHIPGQRPGLGQLKEELREVQNQRAQVENIQSQVQERRKEALSLQFQEWTLDVTGRIPLALVQGSFTSFFEIVPQLPLDGKPAYNMEKEVVYTMEQKLNEEEFVEYLYPLIRDFSTDVFQEFLHHLAQCADMFHETIRHDIRRRRFSDLFLECDPGKVGFLDRQRVLALMESFYDNMYSESEEWQLRNPRQWPVIDISEMDPEDFWANFQEVEQHTEEKDDDSRSLLLEPSEGNTQIKDLISNLMEGSPAEDNVDKETHFLEVKSLSDSASKLMEDIPHEDSSNKDPHIIQGQPFSETTSQLMESRLSEDNSDKVPHIEGEPWSETTTQLMQGRLPEDISDKAPHLIEGKPWSGELLTRDLAIRYSSYGDRSQDECSAAASQFTDLHPIITDIHSRGPSHVASAFNSSKLNLPQFVQLLETFLGDAAPLSVVDKLSTFIQKEYVETEEEKMLLISKVRQDAQMARQKLVVQALFEKWDNDGSGFLELSEVEAVLSKYKDGMESEVMDKGRETLSSSQSQRGVWKLSAYDFYKYIQSVVSKLPGPDSEVFENVVEFLTSSVERTQAEKTRGTSRRKWLQHIQAVAETSGGNLDPVYKALFQALYKDAEAHGSNKKISAHICLLEQSTVDEKCTEVLRCVACTSEDASYVLNRTLHRNMKNVSFAAIDQGIPVHVPRVQYHGNIHFWNIVRPEEERKGSLIVLPLIDAQQRVFGTLSIDTLRDTRERNIFLTHEMSFYQGITNMFSTAYHHIEMHKNILQLVSSALAWIYSRTPNIQVINTYLMEPCLDKTQGYVFRNMMRTDNKTGVSEIFSCPTTLRRRDNLFRDYLFKCADSSEVITTDAYGERHTAVPIRDLAGRAIGVLDLSTGQCWELPAHEHQDLQKMLQMLQEACNEILKQYNADLERGRIPDHTPVGVLFHHFMLQDLRQCVSKLDHQSFAELKSYKEPPSMVHSILKAVLLLFCPDWAESEEIHSWNHCKLKVNSDLVRKILSFNPTDQSVQINPEILAKYIKGIPRGAVWKHGSIPAEHLYNWAFTCMSLLELTRKMQNNEQPARLDQPAPN